MINFSSKIIYYRSCEGEDLSLGPAARANESSEVDYLNPERVREKAYLTGEKRIVICRQNA